ncbi:hypothetical protein SAMN05421636_1186 [Pricia antarctica]|uniref:Uncharacterized protein n=1 Tax=Pricia antarctica TaxID=641691 RepID=A0A1G7J426_9FLAO|nr:DUF6789 family protein [Pricia antarctica]SDF19737.1 hypothetical protein SAMN05421636_1186 [Pricia antarctica]
MDNKLIKSFIAGIIGTTVMSFIMYVAPMMGIPKMNPPAMLAGMMGMPITVGWLMHFVIGIIFAAFYVFLFAPKIKIKSKLLKGAAFGFIVFLFAQIAMAMMGALIGGIPEPEGAMIGVVLGGILGHVVFGIFVALSVKS